MNQDGLFDYDVLMQESNSFEERKIKTESRIDMGRIPWIRECARY